MTLGNLLSHMGIGTKQLTERFSHEYAAPAHDPHMFYSYETAPAHTHVASSKHHHGGGHKGNAAMSALTLLAFLFFLHILQQCLREHMTAMSNPPIVVMTAGREGEENIPKSVSKLDKTGVTTTGAKNNAENEKFKNKANNENNEKYKTDASSNEFLKINIEEYTPKIGAQKYKHVFRSTGNTSAAFPGFISATGEE